MFGRCNRHHLHSQLGSPLRLRPHHALTVAFLVIVLPLVGVISALGQHRVDQQRKLVRGSRAGYGFVYA